MPSQASNASPVKGKVTTATPVEEDDDLLFGLVGLDQADTAGASAVNVATDMKTHDDDIALAMKLQEEEYKVARRETKRVKKHVMPNVEVNEGDEIGLSPDGMAQDPALIAE